MALWSLSFRERSKHSVFSTRPPALFFSYLDLWETAISKIPYQSRWDWWSSNCLSHGDVAPRFRVTFHSALDYNQDMKLRSTEFSPVRCRWPSTWTATRSQRLTSLLSHYSQRSKIPTICPSSELLYDLSPHFAGSKRAKRAMISEQWSTRGLFLFSQALLWWKLSNKCAHDRSGQTLDDTHTHTIPNHLLREHRGWKGVSCLC